MAAMHTKANFHPNERPTMMAMRIEDPAARIVPRTEPLMPARRFASVERKAAREPEVTVSLSKNSISCGCVSLRRFIRWHGSYLSKNSGEGTLPGCRNKSPRTM